MRNIISSVALALCLALTGIPHHRARAATTPGDARAADFTLKDQFDQQLTFSFPKEKVSVLAFGDRSGSEQIEGWVRPLVERYGGRIDIHGIAVLGGVPSPARPLVRRIMKSRVKYPVMLDWNGAVAKNYDYSDGRANIFVIDREGRILLRAEGPADRDGLSRIYDQIDRLLRR